MDAVKSLVVLRQNANSRRVTSLAIFAGIFTVMAAWPTIGVAEVTSLQGAPAPAAPAQQASPQGVSPDYRLGALDVVTVTVLRHPEFSGEFTVPTNGTVEIPAVGTVNLTGMSLSELDALVEERLKTRLKKPEVTVNLKSPRPMRVAIGGDVKANGYVDARPGWRITEYLSAAGGLVNNIQAADVKVTVTRADGQQQSVFLVDAQQNRDGANLVVNAGDALVFTSAETMSVSIIGEVGTPGVYELRREQSGGLLALVALAGGIKQSASTANVKIMHPGGAQEKVDITKALSSATAAPLPKLSAGDVVVVPELESKFNIVGAVSSGGYIPLRDGNPLTLAEAVGVAKADPSRSRLSRVALIRNVNGKQETKVYDIGRYFKTGDPSLNPQIQDGDIIYIPESNKSSFQGVASALSVGAILFRFLR